MGHRGTQEDEAMFWAGGWRQWGPGCPADASLHASEHAGRAHPVQAAGHEL